jgi:hypothetical protein
VRNFLLIHPSFQAQQLSSRRVVGCVALCESGLEQGGRGGSNSSILFSPLLVRWFGGVEGGKRRFGCGVRKVGRMKEARETNGAGSCSSEVSKRASK